MDKMSGYERTYKFSIPITNPINDYSARPVSHIWIKDKKRGAVGYPNKAGQPVEYWGTSKKLEQPVLSGAVILRQIIWSEV